MLRRAWRFVMYPRPQPDDGEYMKCRQWRVARRREKIAYAAVVATSVLAAYLGYSAGANSDAGLARAGRAATFGACRERVEGRIVSAQGLDALRRSALRKGTPKAEVAAFLTRTQSPIDRQLARAAHPGKPDGEPVHVDPRTELTEAVVEPFRERGLVQCRAQAAVFERELR